MELTKLIRYHRFAPSVRQLASICHFGILFLPQKHDLAVTIPYIWASLSISGDLGVASSIIQRRRAMYNRWLRLVCRMCNPSAAVRSPTNLTAASIDMGILLCPQGRSFEQYRW